MCWFVRLVTSFKICYLKKKEKKEKWIIRLIYVIPDKWTDDGWMSVSSNAPRGQSLSREILEDSSACSTHCNMQ